MELRCNNSILFGVVDEGFIDVKCRSNYCGAGPGVVVLHRFALDTGKLIHTSVYKDPQRRKAPQE